MSPVQTQFTLSECYGSFHAEPSDRKREEFRAPKAYESLRGTNPRAESGLYGDLGVGLGWQDQPRGLVSHL
jgi:hypothetical protein